MAVASPWEESARREKAMKFANHFKERGITSEHLASMHPSVLAHHALMAGMNGLPSEETMTQVHGELNPKPQPTDPFEGL